MAEYQSYGSILCICTLDFILGTHVRPLHWVTSFCRQLRRLENKVLIDQNSPLIYSTLNTMMGQMNIGEDFFRRSHGLAGLKHCMEVSEEQPKKRICGSYRRIPCRARSLSIQHNGESAYFDVPRDAPHGMPLNCSHEECINSGRRFRYCNGKSPPCSVSSQS